MKDLLAKRDWDVGQVQKNGGVFGYLEDEVFIRGLLWFALSATFLGLISQFNIIDNDLFHEIALFREILKTGSFPQNDVFAYVPTISPVVHHEWGTGAILYVITNTFGGKGLLIFKYLITLFICLGVYIFASRRGASDYTFFFIAFFAFFLGQTGFTTLRAQLFSLMLLVVFLFLIEENRKGKTWPLAALLPLYIIWVNLHGGFLIGLGLFCMYICELFLSFYLKERDFVKSLNAIKYQVVTFIAMCFSTLLNPYGIDYLLYIWHAIALDRTPFILEWRPIWQVCSATFEIFLITIIILLYGWHRHKNPLALPGTFLLLAAAWQALWHYRHLSIYAIVLTCYAPTLLEKTEFSPFIKNMGLRFKKTFCLFFIIIGLSGIVMASSNKFWRLRIPITHNGNKNIVVYPVGAVTYLKDMNFAGNMMVHFNIGAYVSWYLFPQAKVSMDSRFEVAYPFDIVSENLAFYNAKEGWQDTLSRYPTDAVLVPRWSPVEALMSQDDQKNSLNWMKVYIDDAYSIYMRSDLAKNYPFTDMRGQKITATFP